MATIKFTEIANKLNYPYNLKSQLSALHTDIINYVVKTFSGTIAEKRKIVDVINTISYIVVVGDTLPHNWKSTSPFVNINLIDDTACRDTLGELYLMSKNIIWDIEPISEEDNTSEVIQPTKVNSVSTVQNTSNTPMNSSISTQDNKSPRRTSEKSDLYLSPPTVPRFDASNFWVSGIVDNNKYGIFQSLPIIPTTQSEISITTDIDKMTNNDLLRLFPTKFIPTRATSLYTRVPNIPFDDTLGLILPINGFSRAEIITNIIQYPHLFRLYRVVDNQFINFYSNIEIEGQLYKVTDVWHTLSDTRIIPYQVDYIKEYVIRRYLLERDIHKVQHKYPIYGILDPFLTLFMTIHGYKKYGYEDAIDLARQCVKSRIAYKQSRNPILRKLQEVNNA